MRYNIMSKSKDVRDMYISALKNSLKKSKEDYEDADLRIICSDPKCGFHITPDLSSHKISGYVRKRENIMTVAQCFFEELWWEGFNHFRETGHELGFELY